VNREGEGSVNVEMSDDEVLSSWNALAKWASPMNNCQPFILRCQHEAQKSKHHFLFTSYSFLLSIPSVSHLQLLLQMPVLKQIISKTPVVLSFIGYH
jgi:hypothetical protein